MGVILNLLNSIKLLKEKNKILEQQIKQIEAKLTNLNTKILSPSIQHLTPEITKTLDANNIWMGEKGVYNYANMAKLDIYYDSGDDKWYCRSQIKELKDVDLTGLVDGNALVWNETTEKWEAGEVAGEIIINNIYDFVGHSYVVTSVVWDDIDKELDITRGYAYAVYK